MRSIFTVHAGEFIVGEHLEKRYKQSINIWVPAKDTGIDLLVTDKLNTKAVLFQVKFSHDHLITNLDPEFRVALRVFGWFTLYPQKIANSSAQYRVFVLIGSKANTRDYVIIQPAELLTRLKHIHPDGFRQGKFQVYIWITANDRCWLARNLSKTDQQKVLEGSFEHQTRDISSYRENWRMVEELSTRKELSTP